MRAPEAENVTEPSLRQARAALSRVIEPGDLLGSLFVQVAGPAVAWRIICTEADPGAAVIHQMGEAAEAAGLVKKKQSPGEVLPAGLERWRTRVNQADAHRQLGVMERLGGGLLIPEDPQWPAALRDLGDAQPIGLWYRGTEGTPSAEQLARLPSPARTLAVVGTREISDYGARVASDIAEELSGHGVCVLSGGAYGVDSTVHRSAMRNAKPMRDRESAGISGLSAPTVAVLACGLDRWYPAGNAGLLRAVAEQGLVLSELPPGASPTRHRFLQRNRLIAALSSATVVVEARWRSGAQNTAHHALDLGRPVGVVPGSIYSPTSAGCHRLLKQTPAHLVADAADAAELMAASSVPAGAERPGVGHGSPDRIHARSGKAQPYDGLDQADLILLDALPKRTLSTPGKLSEVAGLPMTQVLAGLTRLQNRGLARVLNGHWGKNP